MAADHYYSAAKELKIFTLLSDEILFAILHIIAQLLSNKLNCTNGNFTTDS